MKLGIIGTNWITKQFVEAAEMTGEFTLTSVYSRKLVTAQKFGADFKNVTEYFDNLSEFFEQGTFEVVYIASPNNLHFEQTLQALKAKKHVIVEKPCALTQQNSKSYRNTYIIIQSFIALRRLDIFTSRIFKVSSKQLKNCL